MNSTLVRGNIHTTKEKNTCTGGLKMTREQKIEWLKNASNEELMEQYDTSLRYMDKNAFEIEYLEDMDLVRAEVLRRMSK